MPLRGTLAGLLLVASVAALCSARYSLRERPSSNCGFAHYGSSVGSAHRLVETHLPPGVADWNIVVPMPPPCAETRVTGADMRVCDADAPPDVVMRDARSAHVHRAGQLAGFATVNVTVYCILPPPPPPRPPARTTTSVVPPLSHLTDSRATYEMLSNELSSNEVTSNEETSYESESTDLESTELVTTVKPISSTTLPPPPEKTTAQVELTPPTEMVTAPPNITNLPKEKTPHSLKVTINIIPTNQVSTEEDVSQSYSLELPTLSNKEKPDEVVPSQSPRFSSVPYIVTLPRISTMPPWEHFKQPLEPGSPAQLAAAPHWPLGTYPGAPRPPEAQWSPLRPQFPVMPAPYDLMAPRSLTSVYSPLSLLSPRLTFLQRRQPLLFFRHF